MNYELLNVFSMAITYMVSHTLPYWHFLCVSIISIVHMLHVPLYGLAMGYMYIHAQL